MKNQKGITLIALVITIIVMLILVGVTISVSLNGGLFTTAKEAKNETQIAQEKEQLLMAAMGALGENGKVDIGKLDSSLPEVFTGSNGEYTSKTGNIFKVSENGSVTLEGEPSGEEQPDTPDTPVTPPTTQILFTLAGTQYTVEEGTTWITWIMENNMVAEFELYHMIETGYIETGYDVPNSLSIINFHGSSLKTSSGNNVCYGDFIVADDYIYDNSAFYD